MRVLLTLLLISSCVGCITNKKVQLLQNQSSDQDAETNVLISKYDLNTTIYRIKPNDVLSIEINSLSKPEYNFFSLEQPNSNFGNISQENAPITGELVDAEGYIEFPVVGKVKVAGLTLEQVQEKIQEVAHKYVVDPVVKIRLLNFRFTVLGEVRNEGTINSFNQQVSVLEALGLAGGMTDLANRSRLKLLRNTGEDVEVVYLNLLEEEFLTSSYYILHQNDVIIVPPLKQRPFKTSFGSNLGLALSTISTLLLVINLFN